MNRPEAHRYNSLCMPKNRLEALRMDDSMNRPEAHRCFEAIVLDLPEVRRPATARRRTTMYGRTARRRTLWGTARKRPTTRGFTARRRTQPTCNQSSRRSRTRGLTAIRRTHHTRLSPARSQARTRRAFIRVLCTVRASVLALAALAFALVALALAALRGVRGRLVGAAEETVR
jgi:hypothetical protein